MALRLLDSLGHRKNTTSFDFRWWFYPKASAISTYWTKVPLQRGSRLHNFTVTRDLASMHPWSVLDGEERI
jgi:hypothetical protein